VNTFYHIVDKIAGAPRKTEQQSGVQECEKVENNARAASKQLKKAERSAKKHRCYKSVKFSVKSLYLFPSKHVTDH
jgi:hypothetical protein